MRIVKRSVVLTAATALCAAVQSGRAADCSSLATVHLPGTRVTVAQVVAAGDFTPPRAKVISVKTAVCRVAAVSAPSPDSQVEFEVWLPLTNWNGKFQGVGNGGFAGNIEYLSLANVTAHGYAAASTNTGTMPMTLMHPGRCITPKKS